MTDNMNKLLQLVKGIFWNNLQMDSTIAATHLSRKKSAVFELPQEESDKKAA